MFKQLPNNTRRTPMRVLFAAELAYYLATIMMLS